MLTEAEAALLAIWQRWPLDAHRAQRLNAYAEMGLTETRAVQVVNALIDRRDAWEADPVTAGRLARLRASRARTSRR